MKELINLGNAQLMSSIEIAKLTGKAHTKVLRDCRNLNNSYVKLGMTKIGLTSYTDKSNRESPMCNLTKMQTMDLMTGYNLELRIGVIRRWEELEQTVTMTPAEMQLAVMNNLILEISNQKLQLQEQQPMVDSFKTISNSEKLSTVSQVASLFNTGRNRLYKFLKEKNFVMAKGETKNKPYQRWLTSKHFDYKIDLVEGKEFYVTLVTGKGIIMLEKLFQ